MSRASGLPRRALLWLALPAAATPGGRAWAWREQPAAPDVAGDWARSCRPTTATGPVTLCPFCGCPVVGARDHGEAGRLPPG